MSVPIRLGFSFDPRPIRRAERFFKDAIKTVQRIGEQVSKTEFERNLLTKLRNEPGRPRYPLKWRSKKQLRFVMAKLRRERNIPYQRTGKLKRGWNVTTEKTPDGLIVSVENSTPYARFVTGALPVTSRSIRQPMFPHWYDAELIVSESLVSGEALMVKMWNEEIDEAL